MMSSSIYSVKYLTLLTINSLNSSTFKPTQLIQPTQSSQLSQPSQLALPQKWPCLFTESDTTGEKDKEEFFTDKETLEMERFQNLGVIKNAPDYDLKRIQIFESEVKKMKANEIWERSQIVELFFKMISDFGYEEKGKYLDGKM